MIGDGETTKIWGEPWISSEAPLLPHGPVQEDIGDLVVADMLTRGSRTWNLTKIKELLPELVDEILAIKPRETGVPDSYIWYPTTSGIYSAKTGYTAATEMDLHKPTLPPAIALLNWNKMVWNVRCAPKQKLLIWKILHAAIPTGDNLQKRGISLDPRCLHCGEPETIDHLFLHCPLAIQVWELTPIRSSFASGSCPNFLTALETSATWTCLPPTGVT